MHPEIALRLFGTMLEIKSYTLFTMLGALAGVLSALPLLRREGLRAPRAIGLLAVMAAAFLVGARLLNYAVNPGAYGASLHICSLRLAGFSVYGGILGALGALLLWARRAGTDPWPLLDALVLPAGLAFAFARVGCYLNGCCAGIPTDSFWGVPFPVRGGGAEVLSGIMWLPGKDAAMIWRYPTQLFEMSLALLGLVPVLWLYFGKKLPRGAAFLLYGVWFSAMRLLVLPLRSLPYPEIVVSLIYPLFYLALIATGLLLLRRLYRKAKSARRY